MRTTKMNAAAKAELAKAVKALRDAEKALRRVGELDRTWSCDAAHWAGQVSELLSCDGGECGIEAELNRAATR